MTLLPHRIAILAINRHDQADVGIPRATLAAFGAFHERLQRQVTVSGYQGRNVHLPAVAAYQATQIQCAALGDELAETADVRGGF